MYLKKFNHTGRLRLTLLCPLIFAPDALLCFDESVCNPTDLQGIYGFQLSGETTIAGEPQPVTNIGRMLLAGDGGISGYSTVMFAGLLLGNPITGTYEARWDCTISWSLQSDSGAFQHFTGVASRDGKRVHYSQTDPGGAQHGIMAKAPAECKASDLRKEYAFALSGSSIPMLPGGAASPVLAGKGVIKADEYGNFKMSLGGPSAVTTNATIAVDAECLVVIELAFPAKDLETTRVNLRGILVDEAKTMFAIQTDPGAMVSVTFTAR